MPLSAWREFYADVLWHRPRSAYRALQPAMAFLDVDGGALADDRFRAWTRGLTGYPLVDAGMRQLRAEGWMPNRVRMVVASFLVQGPAHRLDLRRPVVHGPFGGRRPRLQPAQLAVGGGHGDRPGAHDPRRRLCAAVGARVGGLAPPGVHEPWKHNPPAGYPAPIVDHAVERRDALARYAAIREG